MMEFLSLQVMEFQQMLKRHHFSTMNILSIIPIKSIWNIFYEWILNTNTNEYYFPIVDKFSIFASRRFQQTSITKTQTSKIRFRSFNKKKNESSFVTCFHFDSYFYPLKISLHSIAEIKEKISNRIGSIRPTCIKEFSTIIFFSLLNLWHL